LRLVVQPSEDIDPVVEGGGGDLLPQHRHRHAPGPRETLVHLKIDALCAVDVDELLSIENMFRGHLYRKGYRLDRYFARPFATTTTTTIREQHLALLRKSTGAEGVDVEAGGDACAGVVTPTPEDLVPARGKAAIDEGADALAGSVVDAQKHGRRRGTDGEGDGRAGIEGVGVVWLQYKVAGHSALVALDQGDRPQAAEVFCAIPIELLFPTVPVRVLFLVTHLGGRRDGTEEQPRHENDETQRGENASANQHTHEILLGKAASSNCYL